MSVPSLQDDVESLDIWGCPLCILHIGSNIIRDHLCSESRVHTERPTDGPCQGMVQITVMVRSEAEGGTLVNHLERLLRNSLGSRCLGEWWRGGVSSIFRSWNLVSIRFSGPSRGRIKGKARCPLRYPHGRNFVFAVSVHVVQSERTRNSLGSLSPPYQTSSGTTP